MDDAAFKGRNVASGTLVHRSKCEKRANSREKSVENSLTSKKRVVCGQFLRDWPRLTHWPDLKHTVFGDFSVEFGLEDFFLLTSSKKT